jgi:hypothetical protein
MTYNVYRAEYKLSFADPLMPPTPVPRTHNAIFVETDEDGGGRILQVGGSLADTNGMYFEEKQGGDLKIRKTSCVNTTLVIFEQQTMLLLYS